MLNHNIAASQLTILKTPLTPVIAKLLTVLLNNIMPKNLQMNLTLNIKVS